MAGAGTAPHSCGVSSARMSGECTCSITVCACFCPMEEAINKARVLIEALPYIKSFHRKLVVIKLGGSAMEGTGNLDSVLQDVMFMSAVGIRPILVHGGGAAISREMTLRGKRPKFLKGRRITDRETLDVVTEVLQGINQDLVRRIRDMGWNAECLADPAEGLLRAVPRPSVEGPESSRIDLGFVGEVESVETARLKRLCESHMIPVVAPLGLGRDGETYNINADSAASFVAQALPAEKLVFLSDVHGIMRDPADERSLVPTLTEQEAASLISQEVIRGGMVPKVEACIAALEAGVNKAHIVDGRIPHSLLLEIFTNKGVGTQILR